MSEMKVAIPIYGKMAVRNFHCPDFLSALLERAVDPVYFLAAEYYRLADNNSPRYFQLKADQYDFNMNRGARRHLNLLSSSLRRFSVRTETTDLRFRETIESLVFEAPVTKVWAYTACVDILRRIPGIGRVACWWENSGNHLHVHENDLRNLGVQCVLTPGFGSYGFEYEGLFAREAKSIGIPVVSGITNYDNVLNRGFRSIMPDCVAVWSRLMADDVIRLQAVPAAKIEITGPVQFDRLFRTPAMGREEFLTGLGLNPAKKTILFAGGVNITRYFEIYSALVDPDSAKTDGDYNVVIRPYPHDKLLGSPEWKVLEGLLAGMENGYVSIPQSTSAEDPATVTRQGDLFGERDLDELHCLLIHSDVMINIYSTISLEAAICDLPVIHMGYDLHTFGHRPNVTTAFQQRQTHNRRKLRLQASKIAQNEQQLITFMNEYLTDRTIDSEARRVYAASECEYMDGKCSQRMAELLRAKYPA